MVAQWTHNFPGRRTYRGGRVTEIRTGESHVGAATGGSVGWVDGCEDGRKVVLDERIGELIRDVRNDVATSTFSWRGLAGDLHMTPCLGCAEATADKDRAKAIQAKVIAVDGQHLFRNETRR